MKNTKLFVLTCLIIAVTAGVLTFWNTLLTFLFSAVVAYLLNPPVKYIMKQTGASRGKAVAVTLGIVITIVSLLISLTLPYLVQQVSGLIHDLQTYAANFDNLVYTVTRYLEHLHVPAEVIQSISDFIAQSDTYILSFALNLLTSMINLSLQIFDLVVIIIVMIYFMLDGQKLLQDFICFLPKAIGDKVAHILSEANNIGKQYIKSRFKISSCMAIAIFIGLKCFGIQYAFVFAIMSFCLDFIPYFGSIIGSIIEIFYAAITGGLSFAAGVAVYVLIVQQLEGNVLAPKIEGDATGIHPITVLFSLLAVNQLFGPLGMLISTPLAAILKIIFCELFNYVVSDDDDKEDSTAARFCEELAQDVSALNKGV
ncbi:MAG: AI-2E family transporter [Clostridia bacterium]|nr:AI-2E family transporter [Clostridia bacterium]